MLKKILLVSTLLSGHGGIETVVTTFCKLMKKRSIGVKLIFLGNLKRRKHSLDWLEGLDYKILSQSDFSFFGIRTLSEIISVYRIKKDWDPDITLALNTGAIKSLYLSNFLGRKKNIVDWAHFSLEKIRKKRLLKLADFHFAISNGIKNEMEDMLGIDSDFVEVIYNPINTKESFLVSRPSERIIKLLYIGRLSGEKDLFLLLKSCSLIDVEWELHILGDGADKKVLIQYANELGIARKIKWHGWQKQPWIYVRDHIGEISAFVLTSRNEGFPMALVEACAHGIFCISTACKTGPSDIINPSNGILCPVGDHISFSNAIMEVETKLKKISQDEIVNSVSKFDGEIYCRKVVSCLENILSKDECK